ncbi:MAG: hypothetical protein IAF94_06590 [Pirellulaceae bacterium]|nr:hypothetical protein [Pirellulaceae bacterium]
MKPRIVPGQAIVNCAAGANAGQPPYPVPRNRISIHYSSIWSGAAA